MHGSAASRSLRTAKSPAPVCVTVTLVDGLVLARSVFNHSVNYRCAMVYGLPELVDEPEEKLAALEVISEHVAPGPVGLRPVARRPRSWPPPPCCAWPSTSPRSRSAKARPTTNPDDLALDVWAGVVPLATVRLAPVADPGLAEGIACSGPHRRRAARSGDHSRG